MSIPQLTHQQLKEVIIKNYETKLPTFVWGTFGIGKSFNVKESGKVIAKQKGLKYSEEKSDYNKDDTFVVRTIPIHQWDVCEIKGLPFPDKDKTKTKFLQTDELPTSGSGIIFFDEFPLAPPLVQANTYQIILDRVLGDYKVPDGYVVMAAGNNAEDRAHNFSMAMPVKNRFSHVNLTVPLVENWILEFATKNNIDVHIMNFLRWKEDYLHTFKPDMEDDINTVATPRTWEYASRSIKGVTDPAFMKIQIGSNVGVAIASEFMSWMELTKSYDIAEMFKTGKFDVPTAIDQLYALIAAIVSYYSKLDTDKNAVAALNMATKFDAEHLIMILSQLKSVDEKFFSKVKKLAPKEWGKVINDNIKFLL